MSDNPRPITEDEREAAGLPRQEATQIPVGQEIPDADGVDNEDRRVEVTDLLVNMFLRQVGHRQEYEKIYRARGLDPVPPGMWGNLNDPRVQLELRTTLAYFIEELMEAFNLLKNKPWKQTARETDPDAFYGELADAWHFWLELLIIAGMTPDLIQKYYFGMAEKNDERRASGY